MIPGRLIRGVAVAAMGASAALAASEAEVVDFTTLELEDLMEIEVSLAGKKEQRLGDIPAAVYIVTREDIRRSGATTIPEALRLVPGMEVSQLNTGLWAISTRGFGIRFAAKMLVLIDGRSVYTPLFSGVYWDVQDTLLEDVAHIEVIRGPGATLWGANAVNGVINIITKSAEATPGGYLSLVGGSEEAQGGFRYGSTLGRGGHFRVFAKHLDHDDQRTMTGDDADDDWEMTRAGFRIDGNAASGDALTLQGDVYDGSSVMVGRFPSYSAPYTRVVADRNRVDGFNLLGRWSREGAEGSAMSLQAYVDHTGRDSFQVVESRQTYDLEYQYRRRVGSRHEIVTGVGFRETRDQLERTETAWVEPDSRSDSLFNVFVQDDMQLSERFRLTVGSKFEHNAYSGFEVQPNIRGFWKVSDKNAFWAAVSRAVRSPARALTDVRIGLTAFPDALLPGVSDQVVLFGNPDFRPESLLAWEFGYRGCARDRDCVDVAAFFNDYDDMLTIEPSAPPYLETDPVTHVVVPLTLQNKRYGRSHGLELSYTRRLTRRVSLSGWYAYLAIHTRLRPDSADTNGPPEADSPKHRGHLRVSFDLPRGFDASLLAYHVDRLPGWDVPAYTRVDSRLSWNPAPGVQASVVIQNLLDRDHVEYDGDLFAVPTRVQRSVHGKVAWRF